MDHMRKVENVCPKVPKQGLDKRDGVINPQTICMNLKHGKFDPLKTLRINRSRP